MKHEISCTILAAALILIGRAAHASPPAEPGSQGRTERPALRVPAMWDKDKAGRNYGQFQWRIGMLTPVVEK